MYNRYIPAQQNAQEKIGPHQAPHCGSEQWFGSGQQWFRQLGKRWNLLGEEAKNAGYAGILKGLGLDDLDSGDILLLLILLLIFLEGEHTELVITLALMLLLGGEEN